MAQRRLNYLKHILSRDDDEIVKKIFVAQKENPTRGDFIKLIEKDLKDLSLTYEEIIANSISKVKFKRKTRAKNAAFEQLLLTQNTHKKVKHIKYDASSHT